MNVAVTPRPPQSSLMVVVAGQKQHNNNIHKTVFVGVVRRAGAPLYSLRSMLADVGK